MKRNKLSKVTTSFSEANLETGLKEKVRYRRPLAATWALLADFSQNSTMHGVKYMSGRQRHWTERIFWAVSLVISVVGCTVMIYKIYDKWDKNPVIISFAEKLTPIYQIPFPAITICPITKAFKQDLDFSRCYRQWHRNGTLDNLTIDEKKNLELILQICNPRFIIEPFRNSPPFKPLKKKEFFSRLKSITARVVNSTSGCVWGAFFHMCEEIFTEIVTEEGICFTFNSLKFSDIFKNTTVIEPDYLNHTKSSESWTLQKGYSTNDKTVYPRRVLEVDYPVLVINLKLNKNDLDYLCRDGFQGYKISLHTPGEIPRPSKQFFNIPLGHYVEVKVKPSMITTSENLKNYDPQRRGCYYDDERVLKFFKVYSQSNCELECLADYTLSVCKCVKFFMPRNISTKICGYTKVRCYVKADQDLTKVNSENELGLYHDASATKYRIPVCNCLPLCTSINYDAEISQSSYEIDKVLNALGVEDFRDRHPNDVSTRVIISFKEAKFVSSKRSELYGWSDFVANCGGLFGLFLGVSILSMIEIIYYIALGLACDVKNGKIKNKKAGKNSEEVPKEMTDVTIVQQFETTDARVY